MTSNQPKLRDLRVFAGGLGVFAAAGAYFAWHRSATTSALALGAVAAVLWALMLVAPRVMDPIYRPWMRASGFIGKCMSTLILTVIYFTVLLPFLVIKRRDPLGLGTEAKESYWESASQTEVRIDRFERPF